MKVAKKSPRKRPAATASRVTLTLPGKTYRIIDELRGDVTRSAWLESLVEKEKVRREREALAELCRQQYTPEVCRETLRLNRLYPIHEG